MNTEKTIHLMLVRGDDFEQAAGHIRNFFDKTLLLQYDVVECVRASSYNGADPEFWQLAEDGVKRNKEFLNGLIEDLSATGIRELDDLRMVAEGYQSKLLHLIAHFVDGFIGIDSMFYNLTDDSHWLSDSARKAVINEPERFWLITANCSYKDRKTASLIQLEGEK